MNKKFTIETFRNTCSDFALKILHLPDFALKISFTEKNKIWMVNAWLLCQSKRVTCSIDWILKKVTKEKCSSNRVWGRIGKLQMHSRNSLETLQHSKFILMLFRKPLCTTSVLVEINLNVRLFRVSKAAILIKSTSWGMKKKMFHLSFISVISVITFNYQYAWVNVLNELCTFWWNSRT